MTINRLHHWSFPVSTRTILLLGVVLFFLAACGQAQPPAQTSSPTVEPAASAVTADESAAPTGQKVTLGLGYIPNVQFAPFYLASEKGYYAEEGLDVEFSYGGNVNDLLLQVAGGKLPFVAASGDEVLLARSQQVPVRMVFLLYQKMPVAVFSKQAAGIATPADLRGKTIGVPGRFGATYIGLRGLLHAAGMSETDVTLSEIGFAQFEAVSTDKVPAAVGYANNEPLRMREAGADVNVINVADYISLVNNGIVVSEAFAAEQPETVRRFVRATRRGLEATLANPDEAFAAALVQIPELAAEQQPFERKVLAESLNYWRTPDTDREGLGWLNPPAWRTTYDFLRSTGILAQETDPEQAYTLEFLK
jgi:NitT/TauT family transport system substrate-binding protein